jgi:hypothetical protein
MCIARIIVAKSIASILHIVIVMWPRCAHRCAALVERYGSERGDEGLLFLDLFSQGLNLLPQFFCFLYQF